MNSLPLSLVNDYLFCERRAGLKIIDGVRDENEHTLLGDQVHEHVDFSGYEQRAGWTLLRALPLYSDRLGLSGKADIVEIHRDSATGVICDARPVEYKKGPKRKFSNDAAQLCAQALCLEEMFGISIESGAIFHAASGRRSEIVFDAPLRGKTIAAVDSLHSLLKSDAIPAAHLRPQCEGCSLRETCFPEASESKGISTEKLFEPLEYYF
jgi:CRISPR-associated exonuclease Cas4